MRKKYQKPKSEVVHFAYKENMLDNVSTETDTTPAGPGDPDDARSFSINLWESDADEEE
ncbi:MAG: hypothetical protein IJ549_00960 [Prevotella sp.]|nr:hypothetical protein [Prevotella sp.]